MGILSLKYVVYSDGLRYMLSVLYVSSIETCKNTQVASVFRQIKASSKNIPTSVCQFTVKLQPLHEENQSPLWPRALCVDP